MLALGPVPVAGTPSGALACPGRRSGSGFMAGTSPDSVLGPGALPTAGASCSEEALEGVAGAAPHGLDSDLGRTFSDSSSPCPVAGPGSDILSDRSDILRARSETGSHACSASDAGSGAGTGWGWGSGSEPGVGALMPGAAVWQDRQGTTVRSDESPRERPPQPPLRLGAAAFPIEPGDPSAAEPAVGVGRAGGAVACARPAPRPPAVVLRASRGPELDPRAGPWERALGSTCAPVHLRWAGGASGGEGAPRAATPARVPARVRRWGKTMLNAQPAGCQRRSSQRRRLPAPNPTPRLAAAQEEAAAGAALRTH